MDAELKQKWVDALRSGKFRQTDSVLRSKDGCFCCLGVLCAVAGAEWTHYEGVDDDGEYASFNDVPVIAGRLVSSGEDQELHESYMRDIGLPKEEQGTLVAMNDGQNDGPKSTFEEIANYIEAKL